MRQLKTLLERANSDLKERLKVHEEQYPNSGAWLKAILSEHYFVTDLPYGAIIDIESLYKEPKVDIFGKFESVVL